MKKQTTKRALAGVLAVLTVAGSAPANVGGLILAQNFAITASAATPVSFDFESDEVKNCIDSIAYGSQNLDNDAIRQMRSFKITESAAVTIKSYLDLSFEFDDGGVEYDGTHSAERANAVKKTGTNKYEVVAGYSINDGEDDYVAGDEIVIANLTDFQKKQNEYAAYTVTRVGLTNKIDNLEKSGNDTDGYTYTFTMPKESFTIDAKTSAVDLFNGGKWQVSNKAVTFDPLDDTAKLGFIMQSMPDYSELTLDDGAWLLDEDIQAYKNELVTVASDKPFILHVGSSASLTEATVDEAIAKVSSPLEVVSKYDVDKKEYRASFRVPKLKQTEDPMNNLVIVEKLEEAFTFSTKNDGTVLVGTGKKTGTEADIAWTKAEVVSPTAVDPATLDPSEWDAEAKELATKKEVPNGSIVNVSIEKDPNFTTEFTNNADVQVVIKKDGKELKDDDLIADFIDAYYYQDGDDIQEGEFDDALTYEDAKKCPDILLRGLKISKAGKYEITFNVRAFSEVDTPVEKSVSFTFTIARRKELTLSNAKVYAYTKQEGILKNDQEMYLVKDENDKVIGLTNTVGAAEDKVYAVLMSKSGSGVYTAKTVKDQLKNTTVYAVANLFKDTKANVPIDSETSGSTAISTSDSSANASIKYYDNEYTSGTATIPFSWIVSSKNLDPTVEPVNEYGVAYEGADGVYNVLGWNGSYDGVSSQFAEDAEADAHKNYYMLTTLDTIDTLQDQIMDAIMLTNIDEKDVSFGYVKGFDANVNIEDELTYHEDGLPTTDGEYSVFIRNKGEDLAAFNLMVKKFAIYGAPTEKQLTLTYGDKLFKADEIKYDDYNGNEAAVEVLNPSIKVFPATKMTSAQIKKITEDNKYKETEGYTTDAFKIGDDWYYLSQEDYNLGALSMKANPDAAGAGIQASGDEYVNEYVQYDGILNAGFYIVQINSQAGTKIDNTDYSLMKRYYPLEIQKKALRSDMIVIKPKIYDGKSQTVADSDVIGTNIDTLDENDNKLEIDMKISSGTNSGTDIGAYNVKVAAKGLSAQNYSGEVAVQWHIVPEVVNDDAYNLANLTWDDDLTTIYDNGQIHVQVNRPTDASFKDVKIKQWGVLIEKDGKLKPLEYDTLEEYKEYKDDDVIGLGNYDGDPNEDVIDDAYDVLQFGNGLKEGKWNSTMETKYKKNTVYGANINVTGVETGAWLRPYILLTDGKVCYGTVRYINLQEEATDKLNLKLSELGAADIAQNTASTKVEVFETVTAAEKKDKSYRDKIMSGYDVERGGFYVYGSYTLDADFTGTDTAVKQFGVIVDKTGKFTPENENEADGIEKGGKLKTDDTVSVKKGLVLGKKFIEGKAKANNEVYDEDEYGALIKPADGVSGVWVRAYVDLGNDLVVYTDPQFIKSTTEQFAAEELRPKLTAENSAAGAKVQMTVTANTNYTVKYVGAIFDTKGVLLSTNDKGFLEEDAEWKTAFDGNTVDTVNRAVTEMVLEKADANGFLKTKKSPKINGNVVYNPALSFSLNEKAVDTGTGKYPFIIRPYVIYEIDGNEVTVYGDVYKIDSDVRYTGVAGNFTEYVVENTVDADGVTVPNSSQKTEAKELWYFKEI